MSNIAYDYFNQAVIKFVRDLQRISPGDKNLLVIGAGLPMFISANKKKIQQTFKSCCEMYRDQLEQKDERFFLEHDAASYKESYKQLRDAGHIQLAATRPSLDGETPSSFGKIVDRIKDHWSTMHEDDKRQVWEHIHCLMAFSDKCTA